ncbi:hypothetical protein HK102_001959, partial [Quaeritorhiza haematococci]
EETEAQTSQAEQQLTVQNLIRAFNTILNDGAIEFIGTRTGAVPWLKGQQSEPPSPKSNLS